MDKRLARFCVLLVIVGIIGVFSVYAAEINMNDAGVEAPGILPSNPFYFFKEWSRSIRKTFAFTDAKKAETELDFLNEQIAELKKLDELHSPKKEVFEKTLASYTDGVKAFKIRLGTLRISPRLATLTLERAFQHYEALESLQIDPLLLEHAARTLVEMAGVVVGEDASSIVNNAHGGTREWRVAAFLDRLASETQGETRDALLGAKDIALHRWSGRFSVNEVIMQETDARVTLRLLDSVREIIDDQDLKNRITFIRQDTLEKMKSGGLVDEKDAQKILKETADLVEEAHEFFVSAGSDWRATLDDVLRRAEFNLGSAKQFNEEKTFANAYSQSAASRAAAEQVIVRLAGTSGGRKKQIESIKQYFDGVTSRAQKVKGDAGSELQLLLMKTGIEIARTTDAMAKNGNERKIDGDIRTLETRLAIIDEVTDRALAK